MKLEHVTKYYNNSIEQVNIFNDVTIELPNYGFVLFIGESGIGKTTLFSMISNKDRDYEGVIENVGKIEYLNQKIDLFENLTVIENLIIVCKDYDRIYDLLNEFNVNELIKKKVKKLSNGEKRRVQIIRSLLMNPDLLLCDEPTASLDQENSRKVLEFLKQVSQKCLVYMISHDKLSRSYVDSIYEIKNYQIICITRDEKESTYQHLAYNKKRTWIDYVKTAFLYIKAHCFSYVITVCLITLLIISSYSLYFYINKSSEQMQKQNWQYSLNVVQSIPLKSEFNQDYQRKMYSEFDLYSYNDLKKTLNDQDIIGYTWQVDYYTYQYTINEHKKDIMKQTFDYFIDYTYLSQGWERYKAPYMTRLPIYELAQEISKNSQSMSDAYTYDEIYTYAYNMIDINKLELIQGHYPTKYDEVIVGYDTAKQMCDILKYDDISDLLNQSITMEFNINEDDSYKLSKQLVITGITPIENEFENRIYFQDQALLKIISEVCDVSYEKIQYNVVKYLVDPTIDSEIVAKKLNNKLNQEYNMIKVFDTKDSVYGESIQMAKVNSTYIIIISIVAMVVLLGGLIFNKYNYAKQLIKEKNILENYHYSYIKIEVLTYFYITIITLILSCTLIPLFIKGINLLCQMILGREILILSMTSLIICSIFMCFITIVINMILTYVNAKRYKL